MPLTQIFATYGDNANDRPDNAIAVVDGASGDINSGFGGKFVWVVAEYHNVRDRAISDLRIDVQDNAENGRIDLSKGSGGKYRYLSWRYDGTPKITKVMLLRRSHAVSWDEVYALGFTGCTSDINAGRGGDFLYLVWNV